VFYLKKRMYLDIFININQYESIGYLRSNKNITFCLLRINLNKLLNQNVTDLFILNR